MTFVAYARARRLGIAMREIREGHAIIDAQLTTGYESGSGFRDAFSRIMGTPPSQSHQVHVLKAAWLDTPLGPMLAIGDETQLYLLEFADRRGLEREVERLRKKNRAAVIPGDSPPITSIRNELAAYFAGTLIHFTTPLALQGTPYQLEVWEALQRIPPGETRFYSQIAATLGRPQAARAVARANGTNQLAIVIPCHRVINSSGQLGGYGGGLSRKQWLLDHEKQAVVNKGV